MQHCAGMKCVEWLIRAKVSRESRNLQVPLGELAALSLTSQHTALLSASLRMLVSAGKHFESVLYVVCRMKLI